MAENKFREKKLRKKTEKMRLLPFYVLTAYLKLLVAYDGKRRSFGSG